MSHVVQGYNPRTGEPFGEPVAKTPDSEVDRIASAAATAFSAWSVVPAADRAVVLEKVADALNAESSLLVSTADG